MILRWASPALVPFSILLVMVLLAGIVLGAEYGALAMTVYATLGLLVFLFSRLRLLVD